ncbi:MAG: cation:proton antiporter, partial [Bacteroidetes bacterium]|nr:cation:proton antiporter [Bacteroidota bacterium]
MPIEIPIFELPFFTNLLILLVVGKVLGEIFERFKQPAMIGEIIAGIIIGPSLFGIVARTEDIKVISELGVFLLVIIAGLEINIDDILKSLKGKNIIVSVLAFFVPMGCGLLVGHWFGLKAMTTVFVGLCIAITALPVSIRILMDLGKLNTEIGQKIISIAIFDDVLALTILGVLLNIQEDTVMTFEAVTKIALFSFMKLTAFILVLVGSYYFIKRVKNKGNYIEEWLNKSSTIIRGKESLFALFFVFVLVFAMITEVLGFHFIIGAFFASMLLSESIIGRKNLKAIENTTSRIAMGFLAPFFFTSIGLEFNFTSIENIGLLVAIVSVSYFSKFIGGYVGGKLAGLDNRVALILGIGLNARGIMELVIANIAYKAGLISEQIFSILVIMGILTTLTTPMMLKW